MLSCRSIVLSLDKCDDFLIPNLFTVMKKFLLPTLAFCVLTGVSVWAQRVWQSDLYDDSVDMYYEVDYVPEEEASLANRVDIYGEPYDQAVLTIPAVIYNDGGVVSTTGPATQHEYLLKVVEIGQYALYQASVQQVVFAEGSNLRVIREGGMSCMYNLTGTLTLPEGIALIEKEGLYAGDNGGEMPLTKLVLPSSLDSLCLRSIVLDEVEEIEFLGMVPPHCEMTKSGSDYTGLPWMIDKNSSHNTSKTIKVIVPNGALHAYQQAAGIGDYFTCLEEKPSALEDFMFDNLKGVRKVAIDGQVYIQTEDGTLYNIAGARVRE